jgi:pimeloyl-ACP methyl ester carboxylesterase
LAIATANAPSWTAPPPQPGPLAIDRLDQLQVPTVVLIGGLDIPDFQRLADKIAREVPHAHKILVRETDHALNVESAEQFNNIVLRFLALNGAPGA